jgi:hypothetical protein
MINFNTGANAFGITSCTIGVSIVIHVYGETGNVVEMGKHAGEFKDP